MNDNLRPSEGVVTVVSVTKADAGRSAESPHAQTMAPPATAVIPARPHLSLIGKDEIVAAVVAEFDKQIDAPHQVPVVRGELQEWEDWAASGVTLFRHVTAMLGLPSTMHLPTRLLTPEVRGKLCDLRDALEHEAAAQAKR